MAYVEFWGGVGVIGSSKVLIGEGGHRVLLDLGLDIPRETDLFRDPVRLRPGQELSARLRVGAAAAIPGVYDPAGLGSGDPLCDRLAELGDRTAVFVSHPHIDHVGLAGFVRPEIPLHAAPAAIDLLGALAAGGDVLPGPRDFTAPQTAWVPTETGMKVRVGPMTVERFDLDHDVPGASGYRVTTSDGVLAYTGDVRFHGHHPERSWAFAAGVVGCDVLVTEGTALGFDQAYPPRTEADVARDYAAALAASSDLMLQAVYPRDLDRVRALTAIAAELGRVIAWPEHTAAFLRAAGIGAAAADLAAIRDSPGAYVVQVDPGDLPSLLDLPLGVGSAVLHANGEPLGPFDPRWGLFTDWITHCGLTLRQIGCSGHAYADDLHEMVHRISPKIVMPIHTRSPYGLHPVGGPARIVVGYAKRYDFVGRPLRLSHLAPGIAGINSGSTETVETSALVMTAGAGSPWCARVPAGAACSVSQPLAVLLKPQGIVPVLTMVEIPEDEFYGDTVASNQITIAGQTLEHWVGGETGHSTCTSVCGTNQCRTVEVGGETYEAIPDSLIIEGGLRAAREPAEAR